MFTDMANEQFKNGVEIYDCFDRRAYRQLEFFQPFVLIVMGSHPAYNSLAGRVVTDNAGNSAVVHAVRNGGNCVFLSIDKELAKSGVARL